ncbi:MAG: archaetidylinositol phosphate synthase [Candidatus Bathyarchaeota archaeon]|nr:archaetidylinositol phosphate synthase [Candidatus Bathyarchaeota archaeon]
MVSSKLKKRFEGVVAGAVKPLADAGVTPNIVTVSGLIVSFAAAFCYVYWRTAPYLLPLAGVLILLSGVLDAVDGVIARTTNRVTVFGGFLDSVSDRYSDALVISGLILGGLCDSKWGLITLSGSLLVSYTRAKSESLGIPMAAVGFAERAERMILLTLLTFGATLWLEFLDYGVILLALLTHITVVQRVLYFKEKTA